MKKFIRENFILFLALLLLVGGGFLYYFRASYKNFVVDFHFSKTVKQALRSYELVAVVDEESYTVQNTAKSAKTPHKIRLEKIANKQAFKTSYPNFYQEDVPNYQLGKIENISLQQSQPLFLFNIENGIRFGKLQAASAAYLTDFNQAKEIVKNLLKVYNAELTPDFLYSLYAYEGNLGNFLTFTNAKKWLLWYNGENLAIYRWIEK